MVAQSKYQGWTVSQSRDPRFESGFGIPRRDPVSCCQISGRFTAHGSPIEEIGLPLVNTPRYWVHPCAVIPRKGVFLEGFCV